MLGSAPIALRLLGTTALVLAIGCEANVLLPDRVLPAGWRVWVINVENMSDQPARLVVAEDVPPIGEVVGLADPAQVPPQTTMDVRFEVPPGEGWAIFVNPGPERGPLLLARDVPADVAGDLPLLISIAPNGDPGTTVPVNLGPGWMGE